MRANYTLLSGSGGVVRVPIYAPPIAYRVSPLAYWKVIVAAENTTLRRGEAVLVKIENVEIPGNAIVTPLSLMRNENGVLVDVYDSLPKTRIESPRELGHAAFLAVKNGRIEEGDLLGVVEVCAVGIGRLEDMTKLEVPDVSVRAERRDVNLVWSGRRRMQVREYGYRRRHIAEWVPLVADEDVDVTSGDVREVPVRKVRLPSQTVPTPLGIVRHPLGTVIDVKGKSPRKVEEGYTIDSAVFVSIRSGKIERGDLIGVLSNYYISLGDMPSGSPVLGRQEFNLVYDRGDEIVRRKFSFEPLGFKRSEIGILHPIVAAESVELRRGEVRTVRVEDVNLPAGTIVQPLRERNHPFGVALDVVTARHALIEDDKRVTHAVFLAVSDGKIEKGDLIGVLDVHHVVVLSPARMESLGIF